MVQGLRIRLPTQGTWVLSLVWEDPTCCRATKPMHQNYWGLRPPTEKPLQWEACAPHLEKRPDEAMKTPRSQKQSKEVYLACQAASVRVRNKVMGLLTPVLRKLQLSILRNCSNFRVLTLSSPHCFWESGPHQVSATLATGLLLINACYICIGYSLLCCKPPPTHFGTPCCCCC